MTTLADMQADAHFARVQAADLRRQLDQERKLSAELLAALKLTSSALDQLHREGLAEYWPISAQAAAIIAKATAE